MKGVVFTELLEMAETHYSLAVVDQVLTDANVASGGAYTAVGTYPAAELFTIVAALARRVEVPIPTLLLGFGEHLAATFARRFPHLFGQTSDALTFIASVESYVHPEVHKLYADAEVPRFTVERSDPTSLELLYESPRALGALAEGLVLGVGRHYGQPLTVSRQDLSADGTRVRLVIRRVLGRGEA
jgi:hypothetical protein